MNETWSVPRGIWQRKTRATDAEGKAPMGADSGFHARPVGTTGHESLTPEGVVVAWAVNEYWAAVLVALLNGAAATEWPIAAPSGLGNVDFDVIAGKLVPDAEEEGCR